MILLLGVSFCLSVVLGPLYIGSSRAASSVRASTLTVVDGVALGSSYKMILSLLELSLNTDFIFILPIQDDHFFLFANRTG